MNLIKQLKRHEGFKGKPYECTSGKTTIAYGRNLDANPLTHAEGEMLLANDVTEVRDELAKHIVLDQLSEERQAVLINMAFNLGVTGLMGFKRMLAAVQRETWDVAAEEMLNSRWASQVGNRAVELAQQMKTGEWQTG